MAGLFSPKTPAVPTPLPSPIVDQAAIDRQVADRARRRKGVAANVLAGDTTGGMTGAQKLGGE